MAFSHSFNATLEQDDVTPSTFVAMGQVVSIDGPESTVSEVETTHLTTTNGAKTFIPGLLDNGTLSGTVRFDKAQYTIWKGLLRKTPDYVWRLTISDGSKLEFAGFPTRLGMTIPEDGTVDCPFAIKVTGEVTYTAAP